MHSRKVQQRLNEKLWLVENYFRTHGGWRSNGPSHISQCSQNPSKSIINALSLITAPSPPAPLHPPCRITTLQRPQVPLEAAAGNLCMPLHTPRRSKLPSVFVSSPLFSQPIFIKYQTDIGLGWLTIGLSVSWELYSCWICHVTFQKHSSNLWELHGFLFLARWNIKSKCQFWIFLMFPLPVFSGFQPFEEKSLSRSCHSNHPSPQCWLGKCPSWSHKFIGNICRFRPECISQPPLIIFNLFFHVVQLSEFLLQIVEWKIFFFIQKEKLLQFSVFGLKCVKL